MDKIESFLISSLLSRTQVVLEKPLSTQHRALNAANLVCVQSIYSFKRPEITTLKWKMNLWNHFSICKTLIYNKYIPVHLKNILGFVRVGREVNLPKNMRQHKTRFSCWQIDFRDVQENVQIYCNEMGFHLFLLFTLFFASARSPLIEPVKVNLGPYGKWNIHYL